MPDSRFIPSVLFNAGQDFWRGDANAKQTARTNIGVQSLVPGERPNANNFLNYIFEEDGVLKGYYRQLGISDIASLSTRLSDIDTAINSINTTIGGMSCDVGGSGKYIQKVTQSNGKVTATAGSIKNTYASNDTEPISGKGVAAAIAGLKVNAVSGDLSKTISSWSETNGVVSISFDKIAIGGDQVTLGSFTNGHFVMADTNGHLVDSGKSASSFMNALSSAVIYNTSKSGDAKTGAGRTIMTLQQSTTGQLSATFGDISILYSQVSMPDSSYIAGELMKLDSSGHLVAAGVALPTTQRGPQSGDYLLFGSPNGGSTDYWYTDQLKFAANSDSDYQFLNEKGVWTGIPVASNAVVGGFKTGHSASGTDYPVKIDSNASTAFVTVPDMFELTEGGYTSHPTGVLMALTCQDRTSGASVSILGRSNNLKAWPSSSSATTLGYLAPNYNSTNDEGKVLQISSGKVAWGNYSGLFQATRSTTFSEIRAAKNAGKLVYTLDSRNASGTYYFLAGEDSSGYDFRPLVVDPIQRSKTIHCSNYSTWHEELHTQFYPIDISGTYGSASNTIYML